jgi:hypothetical protein
METTPTITLTDLEKKIAVIMGTARYEAVKAWFEERGLECRDSLKANVLGAEAELAFCKMFNVYPDWTTNSRVGGFDIVFPGLRTEVKGAPDWGRNTLLMVQNKESPDDFDIGVLMIGSDGQYRFGGWLWSHEICKSESLADNQPDVKNINGNPYVVREYKLRTDWQEFAVFWRPVDSWQKDEVAYTKEPDEVVACQR